MRALLPVPGMLGVRPAPGLPSSSCPCANGKRGWDVDARARDPRRRGPPQARRRGVPEASTLGDRTGAVAGDGVGLPPALRELCRPGAIVRVRGRFRVHERYGPQLDLVGLRAAQAEEYEPGELLDGPPRTAAQMELDLRQLLETIQCPHLGALLGARARRGVPGVGALPRRAGGQALPPGLPPRPARALALGRAGR